MANRFDRIYTLPERVYTEGAPVIIEAGALLKDNKDGTVIAQFKIMNIQPLGIKAVHIKIEPFDIAGRSVGEGVSFQYLDLAVERDQEFGERTPVSLPDASTRSISVSVDEVIFSDNTIWTDKNAVWAALPKPEELDRRIADMETRRQFHIHFGSASNFYPSEARELWYCTCGAMNRRYETVCHKCGNKKSDLLHVDIAALEQERDERLAKEIEESESAERECAIEIARKKREKITIITISSIVIAVVLILLILTTFIPNYKYQEAEQMLNSGRYDEAQAAFSGLGDYKDAQEKVSECYYLKGISLVEVEAYETAAGVFEAAGFSYKESESFYNYCLVKMIDFNDGFAYNLAKVYERIDSIKNGSLYDELINLEPIQGLRAFNGTWKESELHGIIFWGNGKANEVILGIDLPYDIWYCNHDFFIDPAHHGHGLWDRDDYAGGFPIKRVRRNLHIAIIEQI